MSILVRNVLLGRETTNVYIEGNRIAGIGPAVEAEQTIDGSGKAILPGFINSHTHAAMTLFRGYVDDMQFWEAWPERIWPLEGKLTKEDVYWGTRLACLEMIKSGTTCFNDMYFHPTEIARAAIDAGLRSTISAVFIDTVGGEPTEKKVEDAKKDISDLRRLDSSLVTPALGPHAPYTVSEENLRWIADYAEREDLVIHIHVSETKKEVDDCVSERGKRPVEYLEDIGLLSDRVMAAHCVWLSKREMETLANCNATVIHNPTSNMKLAVGDFMPYETMKNLGINVCLGTDGCASNNNLDMFQTMKFAAVGQKASEASPVVLNARDALSMATENGARGLRIPAGSVKEGMLADVALIDLRRPELIPNHSLTSNIVYSASGSCVDTTICNGKVLMEGGRVEGEEEVMMQAERVVAALLSRD